ncbi:P-loop NTPase fold protein [Tessaracoccus terricola]
MNAAARTPDNWFVIDAPISDVDKDAFGHNDIADNLHRMVTEPSNHRRMIGLFGEFGVGKSTIIQLLQAKLVGHKNLRVIRMSAERHEPVGFHRAAVYGFAEALVDAKEVSASDAEEILEPLRSAQTITISDAAYSPLGRIFTRFQEKLKVTRAGLITLIVATALVLLLLTGVFIAAIGLENWERIRNIALPFVTSATVFVPLIWLITKLSSSEFNFAALITPGTSVTQRPKVEAADEHERAFATLASKAKHRLVVAVDDIDRLSKQQILEALNAIRSFQLTCRKDLRPIFIVSVAEKIIRGALDTDDKLDGEHAQDFLNRLFTLRQEVPVHETLDLRDYARDALHSQAPALAAKLGTRADDVVAMLIHDDVADPRHVVRLINAFSSDYRLALARETRDGRRSLRADTVTVHPDVLARVVVMKTDFAPFFKAALEDLELVNIISGASSVGGTEAETDVLNRFPREEYASLYKYLARTVGWVPADVDLFPFFYLGQDRISQTLGNAQARELRSALANNLSAELAALGSAAETSGHDAVDLFRELLVSVLRELEDPEISNAVSAVIQAAPTASALQDQEVARAVAAAVQQRPDAVSEVAGALVLADCAAAEDAKTLLRLALGVSGDAAESELWDARVQLRSVLGEQAFENWAHVRISDVESWSDVDRWTREDLGDAFAVTLLERAIVLASDPGETAVADEDDFANVVTIAAQVTEQVPVPDMKTLRAAADVGANTYESAIALASAQAFSFTDEELSNLLSGAKASHESLTDDDEPLRELQDRVVELTIRMATQSPGCGFWKEAENPRSSASTGSSLLSQWVERDTYPASKALPALKTMVEQGAETHTSLAKAIIDAWVRDPSGADSEGVPFEDTVREMATLLSKMEDAASAAVVDAWVTALGDEDSCSDVSRFASHILTATSPTDWGDKAMAQLIPRFQRSIDFSTDATEAAEQVLATGRVSVDCERELLAAFVAIFSYGGAYRLRALTSLAELPWSRELSPNVAAAVTPYLSEVPEADYWKLFDLFDARGLVDEGFVAHLDTSTPTDEMKSRAEPLARALPLAHATGLALSAESENAMAVVADRCAHISDDADDTVAALLRKAATTLPPQPVRVAFAHALAKADEDAYAGALHILLTDTLDVGGTLDQYLWAFVTVPLNASEREGIWATVEPKLTSSVQDATAAAVVLRAAEADEEFDRLVAKRIGDVMLHWISEEPNAAVATALGTALGATKKSRAAARKPAARNWRDAEKKAAAGATLNALS